jgi:phenylacetate-CoA ligase
MSQGLSSEAAIRNGQLDSLNELLRKIVPANAFYTEKIRKAGAPDHYESLEEFSRLFPFTTKAEIVLDQQEHPLYGRDLTYPLGAYTRLHATSGTTGRPLRWLDTTESWEVLVRCWMRVYEAAGVNSDDIAFFAFSFGPFLGFWTAFEAGTRSGILCIPGGGLSTLLRLNVIMENRVTIVCCTPSYAIHLGESARAANIELSASAVRRIIVAGEPGGSIAATRARIESLWPGARVFDHHGMTETGPISFECPARPCRLHVIDECYFVEVIDPSTGQPVEKNETGEFVVTTLKRDGSPLLRYRTGDLVRIEHAHEQCECGRSETALAGGILGRADDMIVVRGVNIYPTAVEEIVRSNRGVAEYQARVSLKGPMAQLEITVEPSVECDNVEALLQRLEKQFQTAFTLRIPVASAPRNSLPRAEMKAKRWIKG